jgi:O-methyltransferase involved in polyketide biosynthesis
MPDTVVSNVSDTARWVAVYRAQESARSDALFRDPFAERLAGERGRAIALKARRQMMNGWPIIVRTKIIDDLVLASIREGCDRVVNLAAGLDTRPYRMNLPADLTWIEADLPALVEEKEKIFAGEKPACSLTREKVDLADASRAGSFSTGRSAGRKLPSSSRRGSSCTSTRASSVIWRTTCARGERATGLPTWHLRQSCA